MPSPEVDVAPGPETLDRRCAAARDALDPVSGGSVHGVGEDPEARRTNRGQIDLRAQRFAIAGFQVPVLDGPVPAGRRRRQVDFALDRIVKIRRSASSERRLELEAVVTGRIVARRDRDTPREPQAADLPGNRRGRDRPVGHDDVDARIREDAGHGAGEILREESRIVSQDDRLPVPGAEIAPSVDPDRGARQTPERLERRFLGDDAAPAVGSEDEALRRGQRGEAPDAISSEAVENR